jgi:H+/Cl- antiporter ClcA
MLKRLRIDSFLIQWTMAVGWIAFVAGLSSFLFLKSLEWVTQFREAYPSVMYFLPVFGILIIYVYKKWGKTSEAGNALVMAQMNYSTLILPYAMGFLIWIATLLTHLGGGSAGREGTAIQMSAAFGDFCKKWLLFNAKDRETIVCIAIASGFSAVFGTPLAGIAFAFELNAWKNIQIRSILSCLFGAFGANYFAMFLGAEHMQFPFLDYALHFDSNWYWFIAFALVLGFVARFYIVLHQQAQYLFQRIIPNAYVRIFMGAFMLLILFQVPTAQMYAGLGLETISKAFVDRLPLESGIVKLICTAYTLVIGFKGGEATPLFFVGACIGNSFSGFAPFPVALMASLGFVTVFSAATKTPVMGMVLFYTLFGFNHILIGIFVIIIATMSSGKQSIYAHQPLHRWYASLIF